MSRKPTLVNKEAVNLLRHMIRRKSNLNCDSFSDIQSLHEGISKATSSSLSVQTLSRFFGVIRSDFNPSAFTLDTLARYLNYSSFKHFQVLNESAISRDDEAVFITEVFDNMFSGIDVENPQTSFYTMHRNLLHWLIKNPQYYKDVYSVMAKSRAGRKLYFEDQVNIDGLNRGFGNSLHYYLLHSSSRQEKFYVYSIFCYWYFLNHDVARFDEYFELLQQFTSPEIISFHPNTLDRYYAACVYSQRTHDHNCNYQGYMAMPDFDLLTSSSMPSNSSIQYVAEAYLLTGQFHKAWDLISNAAPVGGDSELKKDNDTELNILKLTSGFLSGNISKRRCLALYLEYVNKQMPRRSEDYCNIFLCMLKYRLFTRQALRKQVMKALDGFVGKTGFAYFKVFFDRYIRADE